MTTVLGTRTLEGKIEEFVRADHAASYIAECVFNDLEGLPAFEDVDSVDAITMATLALCRRWADDWKPSPRSGVFVERPFVLIEDIWFERGESPPKIFLSMATSEDELGFEFEASAIRTEPPKLPVIASALSEFRLECFRLSGRYGAGWMFCPARQS